MIPKETVHQIIETARIDEVVGDYVTLKKRGANLLGLCPFHNEKTPSFTVSPAKGIYKCFGCGKAGSSINFIMDHEQYSYPDALKLLARKYNIEIEEEEKTPEETLEQNLEESLFLINQFAAEYFQNQLVQTENGKAIGLSYFKERGYREEIIEKFKLGYSQDEWKNFTEAALNKGYKLEFLEKTGLTIVKEQKYFDRFKGRVMFPILNISGRVIGFGGRTLQAGKKVAKYLNSPESEIYHKSKVLYGLHLAKRQIVAEDRCFLVEGYTDVISLHQNGIENVVSSSGTSLTTDQIRLIKRYTQNITILFDGDTAGIKAAFRGIDMILEEGLNVRILSFPEGEDPDSFAQKHSTEEVKSFLEEQSFDFIKFKANLLLKETGGDPIKKAGLIREIVGSIALIPDPISRTIFLQECSSIMDIEETVLLSELNKIRRQRVNKNYQETAQQNPPPTSTVEFDAHQALASNESIDSLSIQEKDIIRTLLKYGNSPIKIEVNGDGETKEKELIEATVAEYLVFEIEKDNLSFKNEIYNLIYRKYKSAVENENPFVENELIASTDQKISSLVIECLMEKYTLSENWEEKHKIFTVKEEEILPKKVHKGICSWRLSKIDEMMHQHQEQLKAKAEDYTERMSEMIRLMEAKKALAAELGRIIVY